MPEDSELDKAMKNSTFSVHCSSIHGEPAALTNFQSAGLGEATELPISNVLHVYLGKYIRKINITYKIHEELLNQILPHVWYTYVQNDSFTCHLLSHSHSTFPHDNINGNQKLF